MLDEWHYTLLTGTEDGLVRMFDFYYCEEKDLQDGIRIMRDQPYSCNRIVPDTFLNKNSFETYALGPVESREAVFLRQDQTDRGKDH